MSSDSNPTDPNARLSSTHGDSYAAHLYSCTDANACHSDFDAVADWAQRHHVRVLLGEFGAYSKADLASRLRWTDFVAREAEHHGFAWAYWEFASGFGIYDPSAKIWRADLLKALMP